MKLKYAKLHQPIFIPNIDGKGSGLNLKETLEVGGLSKIKAMRLENSTIFLEVGNVTAGVPITNFSCFVAVNEA